MFAAAPVGAAGATQSANVEAVCPAPTPGTAQCLALVRTDLGARPALAGSSLATPGYYGPADIQSAYALPSGSAGTGLTVAVVDAGDLPTAEQDLATYRTFYGLPSCTAASGCFRKVDQDGGTVYPTNHPEWALEIALDIEMVSAACPNCNILLVEAKTTNLSDLGLAVNRAVTLGAIAVSNSYGGYEFSGQGYYDNTYYNHPGVAITAATGDCGYNCTGSFGGTTWPYVEYPAASRYVVAVGGTRLTTDGSARGWTESAWGNASSGGAGSGCSLYEPKPAWQQDAGCGAHRTQADVSAVADPATGVAVYKGGQWYGGVGGTSAASPIIAAAFALAHGPVTASYPASYLYGDTADLNDVIGGNNDVTEHSCPTNSYLCNGVAGYDGPTGLGTPNGVGAFTALTPATYHAIAPTRLLDTRVGNGLPGQLTANTPGTFQVAGRGGIPSDAKAVTGNVTVVNASSSWAVYLGPDPLSNPPTSTLNFNKGDIVANGLTVGLGSGGTLSATFMSFASDTTDLVFDVTGYFTRDLTGTTYHPVTAARLLDTRVGNGLSAKLAANAPATFQVTGRGGVPSNATAVSGNVTVVNSTFSWAVYVGPDPLANPPTSTINFNNGEIRANNLTVKLGATGSLSATYMSFNGNTTDLVFDVTGYYTADATGVRYVPLAPARLLDTRSGNGLSGTFAANTPRTLQMTGRGGVPSAGATAVTGNVTVVHPSSSWAVFVGSVPTTSPSTSTVNFLGGEIKGNGLTVGLGPSGGISPTYMSLPGNTTDLVFDVTGYFTP